MLDAETLSRPEPFSAARFTAGGVEAAAAGAWLARYGAGLEALFALAFFATLAVVATLDVETRRIPNAIVLPAAAVALGAVALVAPDQLATAAIAGLGAFFFFFVPALVSPKLVGAGDAKLALLIGIVLGADVVSALLLAAFAAGLGAAAYVIAAGRPALKTAIPFGPFLAAGAAVALVAGGGTLYA